MELDRALDTRLTFSTDVAGDTLALAVDGEHDRPVFGDRHRVLNVRCQAPIDRPQPPAVGINPVFVNTPKHEHRFDCEDEPGFKLHPRPGVSSVRNAWRLVHLASDPVTTEVGGDPVSGAPSDAPDRCRHVSQSGTGLCSGYRGAKCRLRPFDQPLRRPGRRADDEAPRSVSAPAPQVHSEIDADEVAINKAVVARDTVDDDVVHRDADRPGVWGRGERGVIVQEGWMRPRLDDQLVGQPIQIKDGHSGNGGLLQRRQGACDKDPRLAHLGDLGAGLEARGGHPHNDTSIVLPVVRARLSERHIERGRQLGRLLRQARGARTAVEIAAAAGVSVETVRKIEHGVVPTPAFFTVVALADACGLTLDALVERMGAASITNVLERSA